MFRFLPLVLLLPVAALAQSQGLDVRPQAERIVGDDLLDSFMGKTMDGAYNFNAFGVPRDRFSEVHNGDSTTDYVEGDLEARGVWTVTSDDLLCYAYPNTTLNGGCFRVWKLGTCYYFYSDGFPEVPDEYTESYWVARTVERGRDATCEELLS